MPLYAEQVSAYLDRISLSSTARDLLREGPNSTHALQAITTLQQHHMSAIPFDNLEIHYSTHHSVIMDMEYIFNLVVTRKRGGTCPQVHLLFAELLRALGFETYCTGGRCNVHTDAVADVGSNNNNEGFGKAAYGTWVHVATLVKIGSQNYIVDTATRDLGSPFPIPLSHDLTMNEMLPRQVRLLYTHLPGFLNQASKYWCKQLRDSPSHPWMDLYCFQETEWQPLDFQVMTAGLKTLGTSWLETKVVCHRILMEDGVPVGYLMVWGEELRKWYKGTMEVLMRFYSEKERVEALGKWFEVELRGEESGAIKGMVTEIKEQFDYYGD